METTYTQVIDQNTGEIRYVPNTPPPKPSRGGTEESPEGTPAPVGEEIPFTAIKDTSELTTILDNLLCNAKKLRYNRRLETGKLDPRRLASYKTSTRLFKQRKISDKNYQFTFLIDTSGSMNSWNKIGVATNAVASTITALEELGFKSAVFSMNNIFTLIKPHDEPFEQKDYHRKMEEAYNEEYGDNNACGGTSEWVAYKETVSYLASHSPKGVTNVVIILSDGEPGTGWDETPVHIGDNSYMVEVDNSYNKTSHLAKFWDKQTTLKVFGLGIKSKAVQVPNNRQIDEVEQLPNVLSNLLTELML